VQIWGGNTVKDPTGTPKHMSVILLNSKSLKRDRKKKRMNVNKITNCKYIVALTVATFAQKSVIVKNLP
jgi:hypothetical protein